MNFALSAPSVASCGADPSGQLPEDGFGFARAQPRADWDNRTLQPRLQTGHAVRCTEPLLARGQCWTDGPEDAARIPCHAAGWPHKPSQVPGSRQRETPRFKLGWNRFERFPSGSPRTGSQKRGNDWLADTSRASFDSCALARGAARRGRIVRSGAKPSPHAASRGCQ